MLGRFFVRKLLLIPYVCALIFLSGCVATYESPSSGLRAPVKFSAPNLEGSFLASTDLMLLVNHMDNKCQAVKLGKIDLDPSHHEEDFYLEAGVRAYLDARYFVNGLGYTIHGDVLFSLVPEPDIQYEIQYMHFEDHSEVMLFKKAPSGELVRIKMDKYASCYKHASDQIDQHDAVSK